MNDVAATARFVQANATTGNGTWAPAVALPLPVASLSAAAVGDALTVVGGESNADGVFNAVYTCAGSACCPAATRAGWRSRAQP